ncbi:unnamed protein product [Darwinula stevensoni]|uniref:KASH domain-containing protein n=1 Tax=Darwinula stevensoni TaxID=69355 RepID=A0A7R8X6S5_9CRUS|nr:unnamed protein product [Darwinula stevensoni]CAG0887178.1 unnamed protein product [Darwinula stevensoni]
MEQKEETPYEKGQKVKHPNVKEQSLEEDVLGTGFESESTEEHLDEMEQKEMHPDEMEQKEKHPDEMEQKEKHPDEMEHKEETLYHLGQKEELPDEKEESIDESVSGTAFESEWTEEHPDEMEQKEEALYHMGQKEEHPDENEQSFAEGVPRTGFQSEWTEEHLDEMEQKEQSPNEMEHKEETLYQIGQKEEYVDEIEECIGEGVSGSAFESEWTVEHPDEMEQMDETPYEREPKVKHPDEKEDSFDNGVPGTGPGTAFESEWTEDRPDETELRVIVDDAPEYAALSKVPFSQIRDIHVFQESPEDEHVFQGDDGNNVRVYKDPSEMEYLTLDHHPPMTLDLSFHEVSETDEYDHEHPLYRTAARTSEVELPHGEYHPGEESGDQVPEEMNSRKKLVVLIEKNKLQERHEAHIHPVMPEFSCDEKVSQVVENLNQPQYCSVENMSEAELLLELSIFSLPGEDSSEDWRKHISDEIARNPMEKKPFDSEDADGSAHHPSTHGASGFGSHALQMHDFMEEELHVPAKGTKPLSDEKDVPTSSVAEEPLRESACPEIWEVYEDMTKEGIPSFFVETEEGLDENDEADGRHFSSDLDTAIDGDFLQTDGVHERYMEPNVYKCEDLEPFLLEEGGLTGFKCDEEHHICESYVGQPVSQNKGQEENLVESAPALLTIPDDTQIQHMEEKQRISVDVPKELIKSEGAAKETPDGSFGVPVFSGMIPCPDVHSEGVADPVDGTHGNFKTVSVISEKGISHPSIENLTDVPEGKPVGDVNEWLVFDDGQLGTAGAEDKRTYRDVLLSGLLQQHEPCDSNRDDFRDYQQAQKENEDSAKSEVENFDKKIMVDVKSQHSIQESAPLEKAAIHLPDEEELKEDFTGFMAGAQIDTDLVLPSPKDFLQEDHQNSSASNESVSSQSETDGEILKAHDDALTVEAQYASIHGRSIQETEQDISNGVALISSFIAETSKDFQIVSSTAMPRSDLCQRLKELEVCINGHIHKLLLLKAQQRRCGLEEGPFTRRLMAESLQLRFQIQESRGQADLEELRDSFKQIMNGSESGISSLIEQFSPESPTESPLNELYQEAVIKSNQISDEEQAKRKEEFESCLETMRNLGRWASLSQNELLTLQPCPASVQEIEGLWREYERRMAEVNDLEKCVPAFNDTGILETLRDLRKNFSAIKNGLDALQEQLSKQETLQALTGKSLSGLLEIEHAMQEDWNAGQILSHVEGLCTEREELSEALISHGITQPHASQFNHVLKLWEELCMEAHEHYTTLLSRMGAIEVRQCHERLMALGEEALVDEIPSGPLLLHAHAQRLQVLQCLVSSQLEASFKDSETEPLASRQRNLLSKVSSRLNHVNRLLHCWEEAKSALEQYGAWVRARERENEEIMCEYPSIAEIPILAQRFLKMQEKLNTETLEEPCRRSLEALEQELKKGDGDRRSEWRVLASSFQSWHTREKNLRAGIHTWMDHLERLQGSIKKFFLLFGGIHKCLVECQRFLGTLHNATLLQEWRHVLRNLPMEEMRTEMDRASEGVSVRDRHSMQHHVWALQSLHASLLQQIQNQLGTLESAAFSRWSVRGMLGGSSRYLSRVLRAALPVQAFMLLLLGLTALYPMCEDEFECIWSNSFRDSLQPMLAYRGGSPPV